MKISEASDIKLGTSSASKVMLGTTKVWPKQDNDHVFYGEVVDASKAVPTVSLNGTTNTPILDTSSNKFYLDNWSNAAPNKITFGNKENIKSINTMKLDTSNVTNMSYMFIDFPYLTSLDLTNFNTSNVTNISSLFFNCRSLTSLDLSSFNTSNVTTIGGMFSGCSSLTSLDLSSFDASKVTNMNNMFNECRSLRSLDLSSFNASQVTSMAGMFSRCRELTSLNLSNFYIGTYGTDDTQHRNMFQDCTSLTDVYINNEQTLRSLTLDLTMAGDPSNNFMFIPDVATIHFNSDPSNPEMIEDYMWSGSSWDPA